MQEYDGTEADAMDDSGFEVELDPSCEGYQEQQEARREAREFYRAIKVMGMTARYNKARQAKTGSMICCPTCLRGFKKKTYNQVFCSNQKTRRGRSSCKDKFHNTTNPRGIGAIRDHNDF